MYWVSISKELLKFRQPDWYQNSHDIILLYPLWKRKKHTHTHGYTAMQFLFYCRNSPPYGLFLVAQSCPTLCDPMDCSPPASSVRGILQARILAWVAMSSSRASSQPRDGTQVSCIAGRFFTIWVIGEAHNHNYEFVIFLAKFFSLHLNIKCKCMYM